MCLNYFSCAGVHTSELQEKESNRFLPLQKGSLQYLCSDHKQYYWGKCRVCLCAAPITWGEKEKHCLVDFLQNSLMDLPK